MDNYCVSKNLRGCWILVKAANLEDANYKVINSRDIAKKSKQTKFSRSSHTIFWPSFEQASNNVVNSGNEVWQYVTVWAKQTDEQRGFFYRILIDLTFQHVIFNSTIERNTLLQISLLLWSSICLNCTYLIKLCFQPREGYYFSAK